VFDTTRDSIRLNRTVVVTDLNTLDAPPDSPDDLFLLDHFLGDFSVDDAPTFCQWVDRERARLLPRLTSQMAEGIAEAKTGGQISRMLALAEHLRRLDPLSEPAARGLLEARTMLGDRLGALADYDNWCERLSHELGAVPSRSISDLASRIRKDPVVVVAPTSTRPLSPQTHSYAGNLIGRADEFQALCEAWRMSANGLSRHSIVLGTVGMGKTTLADHLATLATLEGAAVVRATCHSIERDLPYSLVCKLVSQLIGVPGAGATPPSALAELSRTVPSILELWPGLPLEHVSNGEEARIRLIDAFASLIDTLADEIPIVLVCDNIHLSDAASLAVVHSALRQLLNRPVHAVLTVDPTDAHPTSAVGTFLTQPDSIYASLVELAPLTPEDSETLFSSSLDNPETVSIGLRRAMRSGARGNPLALVVMADACNRGEHCTIPILGMSDPAGQEATPDMRIRTLIWRLVNHLDDDTRRVAQLGAVLGERLTSLEYYAVLGISTADAMRALSTLTDRGILREYKDRLVFANELVRSECYHSIGAPIRRLLHSKIAEVLLGASSRLSDFEHLELAWHLVRAGRVAEATTHLLAGGKGAIKRGAPHEAELALSTCLGVLEGDGRSAATALLAEALQELGRWQDSLRVLGFEESCPMSAGSPEREVLRAIANRWGGNDDPEYLLRTTQRLIDVARSPEPLGIRAGAIAALPYFLSHTIDQTGMSGMGEILCEVEHLHLSPYEQAQITLARAWWLQRSGERERAAIAIQEAEQLVTREGIGSTLAVRIAIGNGLLRSLRGQYDEAVPILERAAHHAKRLENPVQIAAASASLATAYGRLGNYVGQIERARDAVSALSTADCSMLALAAVYELAIGLAFEGSVPEALAESDTLDTRNHRRCPAWASQAAYFMKADVLAVLGEERRALAYARKGMSISPENPLSYDVAGPFARWCARLAVHTTKISDGLRTVGNMKTKLTQLHAKDQAEVLAALHLLESEASLDPYPTLSLLGDHLVRLPVGVHNFLQRTGYESQLSLASGAG